MLSRGKLAGVAVSALVSLGALALWPAAASAQVNAFSIQADRDVYQLDGRAKNYEASQGRFTTGPQPTASGHKQIAGAVEANAEPRTYVVRAYLPTNTTLELGRAYPVNGTLASGGAGLDLTLIASSCSVSNGSFTVNEYSERPDGTPTAMDISFVGTCAYAREQTATFTGRYRLNASATPAPPALPRDATRPRLTGLKFRRSAFKARLGTSVRFRLSEAAQTTFAVQRRTRGRKVGRRCRKPTRSNRGRRSCVRYVAVKGSIPFAGQAGANTLIFRGRVGDKRLRPGRYRLVGVARDVAGNTSSTRRVAFRLKR